MRLRRLLSQRALAGLADVFPQGPIVLARLEVVAVELVVGHAPAERRVGLIGGGKHRILDHNLRSIRSITNQGGALRSTAPRLTASVMPPPPGCRAVVDMPVVAVSQPHRC